MIMMAFVMLLSCQSEYDKMVRSELARGIAHDSLILGMYMGQTQKEFYAHCWDLNKQKLISQGNGNQYARYMIPLDTLSGEDESDKIEMLFYGIFDNEKIMRGMDMIYSYTSWAPWNKSKYADSLAQTLIDQYEFNYPGNSFFTIDSGMEDVPIYVKIDGNRQITIYKKTSKDVTVKIEDLRHKIRSK